MYDYLLIPSNHLTNTFPHSIDGLKISIHAMTCKLFWSQPVLTLIINLLVPGEKPD
jgi:hypothetical protein